MQAGVTKHKYSLPPSSSMPPKLLDITVEIPEAHVSEADLAAVQVSDAGALSASERVSFIHFYAAALAALLENHFSKTAKGSS